MKTITLKQSGYRFSVTADLRITCDTDNPPRHVLCKTVETSWAYDADALLAAVLARGGQSFEGEVAFACDDQVTLFYLEDTLVLSQREFDTFVAAFGAAWFDGARALGVNVSAYAGRRQLLDRLMAQ